MIKLAIPPNTPEQPNTSPRDDEVNQGVLDLLDDPNILARVEEQMRAMGLAGDTRPSMLAYLAITSRHVERPINLSIVGGPSSGKNQKVQYAQDLHPKEAVHYVSASSQRALIYSQEDFQHRMVIMAEADSLPDDGAAASAIRSLVQDRRMIYETVVEFQTVRIVKEGPTGLITTSIRPLKPQLRSRVMEIHVDPDQEAVGEVLQEQARDAKGEVCADSDDRSSTFIAAQKWIAQSGNHIVVIPFADALLPHLHKGSVTILRSFPMLLSAIKACALLHQRQRERDEQDRIIATLADYEMVRPLLDDCFKLLASGGLTQAVRRVVQAVPRFGEISLTRLAKQLDRAKSTVHEQVQQAIEGGWLGNLEFKQGLPSRLVRKDPLPDGDVSGLPSADQLRQRMSDEEHEPEPELDPQFQQAALEVLQELFTVHEINA